jgi:hypothetical protein
MMARANIPLDVRYKIWRYAFKTATLLDGLIVETGGDKTATRYVLWAGENPKFASHLRTWGEAGSIKTRVRGTPKIADRGTQCMMAGYSTDHDGDCYQVWDPIMGGIHDTRDVTWMHRMFFVQEINHGLVIPPMIIPGINENPTGSGEGINDDAIEDETEEGIHVKTVIDEDAESKLPKQGDAASIMGNPTAPNEGVNQTQSGRTIKPPERLIQEIGAFAAQGATAAAIYEIALTAAEIQYYDTMKGLGENAGEYRCVSVGLTEYGQVGAGLGGGFENTQELHVMKYKEAMKTPDKPN